MSLDGNAEYLRVLTVGWSCRASKRRAVDIARAGPFKETLPLSIEDAKKIYPNGWKAPKPYIRIVPQPRS